MNHRSARQFRAGLWILVIPLLVALSLPVFGSLGLNRDLAWAMSILLATTVASAGALFANIRKRGAPGAPETPAQFRALMDMAPAAILVRAATGEISYWNTGAEHLYGWSAAEAIGQVSQELLATVVVDRAGTPSDPDESVESTLNRLSRRAWQGEVSHLTKSGRRIPVRSQWAFIGDDGRAGGAVIEINVDISAEKASEAELRAQSQEIAAAGHIDRIGSQVMTAFNRNSVASEAAADALAALSDEIGYKPLALYEYDEWEASLTLLGGLALGRDFSDRRYQLGSGLVGKAAAAHRPEFLDCAPDSTWALDTGTGDLAAATVFAVPLMFRDQLLGCLAGASPIPLSARERSWLGQIADQMAVGLRSIQQLTQLKSLSAELRDRARRIEL